MDRHILIIGGAGFIGVNAALFFSRNGWKITIVDSLCRKGSQINLDWLKAQTDLTFAKVDIRDRKSLEEIFSKNKIDVVLHLAAQVAVTKSIANPREDFEVNAVGTFNILEAVRHFCPGAIVIYASTNKVYGKMQNTEITVRKERYEYLDRAMGIDEYSPLDLYSPYGCSKGTGDQYVIDYARTYNLRATSFRQSCIYGPHQFGMEDQGWVAWFAIAAVLGKPITIYGDGRQLRDILHVDDLICAYNTAIAHPDTITGEAYNIGGGPNNTLALIELITILEREIGISITYNIDEWRPCDQKVFVCNIEKAKQHLAWQPKIGVFEGIQNLIGWIKQNRNVLLKIFQ